MKITLSFPNTQPNEHRPEVETDVVMVPRIGELLSWNDSLNYKVIDVIHQVKGRDDDSDNEASHRVIVWVG